MINRQIEDVSRQRDRKEMSKVVIRFPSSCDNKVCNLSLNSSPKGAQYSVVHCSATSRCLSKSRLEYMIYSSCKSFQRSSGLAEVTQL